MKVDMLKGYRCPETFAELTLVDGTEHEGRITAGTLGTESGNRYRIENGIPDFTWPLFLPASDAEAKRWYDDNADTYDENLPLTFATFRADEEAVRRDLVRRLELKPEHRVLEIGAGTGRDSRIIAEQLGPDGLLVAQDLSAKILEHSFAKLADCAIPVEYYIGNASYLPFPDGYFDAVFHFGGLNTFADIGRFFRECSRVTKVGGKVVAGDESMPLWLRETEFGRVLMNSNPLYRYDLPLAHLPVSAREVKLEWIIGGVFYVIEYRVGEGEPYADLDFEIPGIRGGTHRSRYYGHLEGITPEVKELAYRARKKSGKSMHRWLDEAVRAAARRELEEE